MAVACEKGRLDATEILGPMKFKQYVLSGPLQSLPFPVLVLSKAGIIGCGGRRGRQGAEIVKTWICWSPLSDKEPHKGFQRESVFILRVHLDGGVKDKRKVMKKI